MSATHSAATTLDVPTSVDWPAQATAQPAKPTSIVHQWHTIAGAAAAIGRFLLHFLEMGIAMGVGMAIFGPVKSGLAAQGYSALQDTSSIDYQAWMNLFMVVPMVLWMCARGHRWRHGVEMSVAMVGPVAVILFLCSLGIEHTLPWFTVSLTGIAMFASMLGYMLYRRDMYTSGYSLGWIRRRFGRS